MGTSCVQMGTVRFREKARMAEEKLADAIKAYPDDKP